MRKLEILFVASLALGGYRGIFTPYGVFALQTLSLFVLIAVKVHQRHFVRTARLFDLLFPVTFFGYLIIRSTVDLLDVVVTLPNIVDFFKPVIVAACLLLSLFRFQLVEDLCKPSTNRLHLTHWVVMFGTLSTFFIVGLHAASLQFGRLDDGLYFSTLYVFSTLLVLSVVLSNQTLFSIKWDLGMLAVLVFRLLVDLRRTPLLVVGGFVTTFLLARILQRIFLGSKNIKSPRFKKILRLVILGVISTSIYSFIASGSFNRLSLSALQYALYDVRILDLKIALEEVFAVDPIFGLGPFFSLNLYHSNQVHSLPGAIFVSYGWFGLILYLMMVVRLVFATLNASVQRQHGSEAKFAFLLASVFYLLFFTFSARGFEIESFSIFALALAIGIRKK